jgi:hypothetical protein
MFETTALLKRSAIFPGKPITFYYRVFAILVIFFLNFYTIKESFSQGIDVHFFKLPVQHYHIL